MNRNARLRANPDTTRAWQDRSQQNARARDYRKSISGNVRATVPFRAPSPPSKKWCVRCERLDRRQRATTYHHWVPQEQIRVYVRGLRLPERAHRRMVRDLIHDARNYSPLCDGCHGHRTLQHAANLTADDVPWSAREFARELGTEWAERLRRAYPEQRAA